MNMIKGLILDVDGVLVGGKQGYNWPNPHVEVLAVLKTLREQGLIVSLCTGKGTFAIHTIVDAAHLDNVHIGDGGAVVIDPLHNTILDHHIIDRSSVKQITKTMQENDIYVELYTKDGYYIQKDTKGEITDKHAAILYREPNVVDSLSATIDTIGVVKIMPIAKNEQDKQRVAELFSPWGTILTLQWGIHPTALPSQFGLITKKGISKKQAAETISHHTGVSLEDMLGVGDGMTDWQFMDICGYAGAMGNATGELKEKVASKGEHGYIGKSVDENGILDILSHFGVIKT